MNKLLEAVNLQKTYSSGEVQTHALRGIEFTFFSNRFYAVTGKSGSGKSTLLHLLSGMETPTKGEVLYRSQNLGIMKDAELSKLKRQKFGFVFQSYNLLPELCVLENIMLPADLDRQKPDKTYIRKILSAMGIQDKIRKYPSQLSGGEQQRTAIARALVNKPEIIFADEPTGNLDSHTSEEVMRLMQKVVKEQKKTLVMVTHDNHLAEYADRVFHIIDGEIVKIVDNREQGKEESEESGKERKQ